MTDSAESEEPIIHAPGCGWETGPHCTCGADPERSADYDAVRQAAIRAVHALKAVEADPTVEQYADAVLGATGTDAAQAYRKVAIGRAERVEDLMAVLDRVREAIRSDDVEYIRGKWMVPVRDITDALDELTRVTSPAEQEAALADWYDTHDAITGRDIPPAEKGQD